MNVIEVDLIYNAYLIEPLVQIEPLIVAWLDSLIDLDPGLWLILLV
jgi:hypothetical protein